MNYTNFIIVRASPVTVNEIGTDVFAAQSLLFGSPLTKFNPDLAGRKPVGVQMEVEVTEPEIVYQFWR